MEVQKRLFRKRTPTEWCFDHTRATARRTPLKTSSRSKLLGSQPLDGVVSLAPPSETSLMRHGLLPAARMMRAGLSTAVRGCLR